MTMSNLFKSVYGTLNKSDKSAKSINQDPDELEEGKNPPAGVDDDEDSEPLSKMATGPNYQTQVITGNNPNPSAMGKSQSLFPVITPIQKSLAQTHGYGDYTVDHVGKSCGVCGRLSKSLEGTVCETCAKSMNSVAWHKSHLE
jgi:hypothetical protein